MCRPTTPDTIHVSQHRAPLSAGCGAFARPAIAISTTVHGEHGWRAVRKGLCARTAYISEPWRLKGQAGRLICGIEGVEELFFVIAPFVRSQWLPISSFCCSLLVFLLCFFPNGSHRTINRLLSTTTTPTGRTIPRPRWHGTTIKRVKHKALPKLAISIIHGMVATDDASLLPVH